MGKQDMLLGLLNITSSPGGAWCRAEPGQAHVGPCELAGGAAAPMHPCSPAWKRELLPLLSP